MLYKTSLQGVFLLQFYFQNVIKSTNYFSILIKFFMEY